MTNDKFIKNFVNDGFPLAKRTNGNLMSVDGVLYSYGIHYPLLWKSNGIVWVNIAGWSRTTSKHISIASQYADHAVKYEASGQPEQLAVFDFLVDEAVNIQKELDSLKKHGTKREANLFDEQRRVKRALVAITGYKFNKVAK